MKQKGSRFTGACAGSAVGKTEIKSTGDLSVTRMELSLQALVAALTVCTMTGCATGPLPPSASTQAAFAERDRVMGGIVQSTVAARAKFLDEHPTDAYRTAINSGVIQLGMSADEVGAAGYGCEVKEQSTIGSVQTCRNVLQDATGPTYSTSPTYFVGFDVNDIVVTISNP